MDAEVFDLRVQQLINRLNVISDQIKVKFADKDRLYFNQIDDKDPGNENYNAYVVAEFYGGLNGPCNWTDYLESIKFLFEEIGKTNRCWLVTLENDCPDDVYNLYVGIEL